MCKHENGMLIEEYICSSDHLLENGKYDSTINNSDGNYSGFIIFICFDCNKRFTFHLKNKNLPKWIQKYIKQIME